MNNREQLILEHMLDDAFDVVKFVGEVGSVEAFASSNLYRKAITMSILNIGELAKKLPQDFKSKHTEIPWKQISGMRDVAAHGYHVMDDEIIWDVATHSIPELIQFLQRHI